MTGSVVLVTGSSRGIGAETARRFAARDEVSAVVVHHRDERKAWMAQSVAASVEKLGARCGVVRADLTVPEQVEHLFSSVRSEFGRIDRVVLNASGGLERGRAGTDYPLRINRDAQLDVVEGALPLMDGSGRFVYVTSHWAHFGYEDLGMYTPVATSKRAGEEALLRRFERLEGSGPGLVVVSGDVVADSTIALMLDRLNPGWIDARRSRVGELPDTAEFSAAIVRAAYGENGREPRTVYVGSTRM